MPRPSILSRLAGLFPGYTPRATPPAVVAETPLQRAERLLAQTQQQLDRSRARPAPSTEERVPRNYHTGIAGRVWFLPYADSATQDTPEIRAAMRLMRRDGYVKAAWEPQIATVASEDWQVQASEAGNAEAEEQAQFVTRVFREYATGGMPSIVRNVCAPLGSDGFTLPEKVWEVAERGRLEGKIVFKAAKAKDPDNLKVEGDEFGNVTHVTSTRRPGEVYPITDFLYARYLTVFDEPFGEAAYRPGYGPYWMRDTVRKLRVIHHEKRMAGMLVGTYANPDDKGVVERALALAKTSTWMSVPEGTRIEAVALSTASEPDYKSFDESLRDEIVTAIAFAALQMMTANSPGDIRGDAGVQKATSDLGPWLLMTIVTQVINEQLIPDLIDFNFPYAAAGGYPKLTFGAVSNAELLELVQIVEAAQRIGLKPSRKHYAGALSIKEADPNDPDDQLQGAGAQPPTGPGGGFGGMGFGSPDPFGAGGGAMFSEGWSSFAWQPAKSRTGSTKAVGTAEDAGRVLYGLPAEAALARQGRTDRGEPHPESGAQQARRLAQEREPGRQDARALFTHVLQNPNALTSESVRTLGARLGDLTKAELRGLANNLAVASGGLKAEVVARLVGHARQKAGLSASVEGATEPPAAVGVAREHSALAVEAGAWSPTQLSNLTDYATDISLDLNRELREGREPADLSEGDYRDIVRDLDAGFDATPPLPKPVQTFRGLRFRSAADVSQFVAGLKPGGDYSDPAYVSTSFDPKVASDFLRGSPGVVMHIDARRGIEMAGLGLKVGDTRTESEFLLPRRQKFKVLGVDPGDGTRPAVVRLEQTDPGGALPPKVSAIQPADDFETGVRRWHVTASAGAVRSTGLKAGIGGGIGGPLSGKGVSVWKDERRAMRFHKEVRDLEVVRTSADPKGDAERIAGIPLSMTDPMAGLWEKKLNRALTPNERAVVHVQAANSPYIPAESFFTSGPPRMWEMLPVDVRRGATAAMEKDEEELYDPVHLRVGGTPPNGSSAA